MSDEWIKKAQKLQQEIEKGMESLVDKMINLKNPTPEQ